MIGHIPLDGETDRTKGFQLDIEVDPGMYSVRMTCDGEDTESYGFYYTKEDTTPPTAEVSYSNNRELTNQDVTVTIQADEAIQAVEGWTLSDDQTTLTKVFSENTDGSVTISDLAGNTATINYTVSGIESDQPDADTAAVDSTGMFAMMLMISAGVVALLQKRRKEE